MNSEYNALAQLRMSDGWQILQALWVKQHEKIVQAMRKAGKQGRETSWRYFAGQQEGFDLAVTQLERAIEDMKRTLDNVEASQEAEEQVNELLRKIKGDGK